MKIEKKLPCGVDIRINHLKSAGVFMVAIEDPGQTSFSTNMDGTELYIGIREENIPVLREILDELNPKPEPSFGTHIREAFRILKAWGNKPVSQPEPTTEVCHACGRGD